MEIRRWQIYVVINCVIVTHLVAKPVSLNELIAAEEKQKQTKQHTKPTGGKTVSLNELIAAESQQNQRKSQDKRPSGRGPQTFSEKENRPAESRQELERAFPKTSAKTTRKKTFSLKDLFAADSTPVKRRIESLLSRTPGAGLFSHRRSLFPALSRKPFESAEDIFPFSPLKFRKKFEIKSPLKPRKIKYSFASRLKRRNQSTKRETNENEIFKHKHIPLIKRIGLLVDDILSPDSGESVERINRRKPRRNKKSNIEDATDLDSTASEPQKAAITTTTIPAETTTDTEDPTSEAPNTTTNYTSTSDVDTLRPDSDLSLPSPRNTSNDRRNYHGVSERSGPAFHGDIEGNIAWNNRSDEFNSRGRGNQTYPSSYEEYPCSATRINKCRDESRVRNRYPNDHTTEETKTYNGRSYNGLFRRNDTERENIFQVGSEETLQIPRNVRLPGPVSDKVVIVDAQSVPPQKSGEKSFDGVTYNHASAERGTEWHGPATTEDQRIRQVIEGVIPIQDLLNPDFLKQHGQQNQVVTIFDGYSVARDINGRNKLSEKSIRISQN